MKFNFTDPQTTYCENLLKSERILQMAYEENPAIFTPQDHTTLWRYMPPLKLFNLLETQTLFFTNVSSFSDPYEGLLPKEVLSLIEKASNTDNFRWEHILNNYRNMMLVNCWHANWRDTRSMWDKYASETGSVAIKTNVASLKKSLVDKYSVHIGYISYIDYEKDIFYTPSSQGGMHIQYTPYFHKQRKFDYECEVRAIINTLDPIRAELESCGKLDKQNPTLIEEIGCQIFQGISRNGLQYKIDVSELIHEIVPSPDSQKWMVETIKSIIGHYDYDIQMN